MKTLGYQQKAVKELVEKSLDLLSQPKRRYKLVFKAPTGSGKTVMASQMLARLSRELRETSDDTSGEAAYIWIAPNKLHEQSYRKMKSWFSETLELRPVVFDDLDHSANGYIKPGEILFVNWESINKDNAIMTRDSELCSSLYDMARRTQQEHDIPIIAIIDEEHLYAGRLANKSENVMKNIDAKLEIRISATPVTNLPDELVNIPREKVIAEQMIKEGIVLNPAMDFKENNSTLNRNLVNIALKKRGELAEAYRSIGVGINPLLLIQLPNDSNEKLTGEDETIREEVTDFLETKGITVCNGRLAVWLSGEKENLDGIGSFTSPTEVLLFKQAIALGWDCPRAAVLLIFREIKSFTFTTQTVGRILRMPQQKFYAKDILNKGYVYTNLSKDIINVVKDDMDYISSLYAKRREGLNNVKLTSEFCERPAASRKRLGVDFKSFLLKRFCERYGVKNTLPLFTVEETEGNTDKEAGERENLQLKNREIAGGKLKFDVGEIAIDIVDDQTLTGEEQLIEVDKKVKYVKSRSELNAAFTAFCLKAIGARFEKVSAATLGYAIKSALMSLFGIEERDTVKVVLCSANLPKIEDWVYTALDSYFAVLVKRQKAKYEKNFEKYEWEVPADRLYNEANHRVREDVKDHALVPFIESDKASTPEKEFEKYLESNAQYIDWWYKNGDAGRQHYAVSYLATNGLHSLFYVDFVVRMKNGNVFLFDTKTSGSDPEACSKHNALAEYINSDDGQKQNLHGGILIREGNNWKYSPNKISDTIDTSEWKCFYPDEC